MSLLPNLDQMTDNEKLAVLESIQKSIAQSKEIQKKKIGENVDLVVQALKKIESDIRDRFDSVGNSIEKRVLSIKDGRDGSNGNDGRDGKDGKSGKDGLKGDRGVDGQAGRDGVDGVDGISVVNANIDFDGSLVITLSDGREINVGEVVSADVAEKIKVISTMSTNAAIAVKEEGTTLTSGVKSLNFVGTGITATTSGDDVTVTVASGSGTVTSVAATAGTGISVSGSPITTSGTLTITNTAPDQTVSLTASTGISTSGTYPSFTITNTAPDQTVALTQGGTTTITGTYPNFTISSADQFQGTVTSVTGTSPVASSGGSTPAISLASGYGDTLNPYASKTANFVLAAPDGSAGAPTFRAVVANDIPTLNQSTTGSAATLTTPRAIYGNNFDGSAALTQVIASTYGGTGNGFTKFTGATTAEKTYTLPDASSTIVVQGGALGTPSSGTLTNCTFPTLNQNTTGTASNVTGTVAVANGGTGQTSYTNGQLLIGNTTGNTLTKATLSAGTGISITNSTGSISIASTATGTVTSVSGTGTASGLTLSGTVTTSGNLTLSGTATVASLTTASGSAPSYSARAWVNFNGTGTVAIRGSGNVTSITDNGTADYTVNFTTAMSDTNYSVAGNCMANVAPGNNARMMVLYPNTTYSNTFAVGSVRILAQDYAGGVGADALAMTVNIFR